VNARVGTRRQSGRWPKMIMGNSNVGPLLLLGAEL
jgi:hypothetical protein